MAMAESIADMVDDNGRVNYRRCLGLINAFAMSYFTDQCLHPFLVGKDLHEGEMTRNLLPAATMRFSMTNDARPEPESESEASKQSSITHAIYMLRKKPFSREMPNVVSVGRSSENDIVIADYVISKQHAQLILFHGMYFIVDLGSTNGTRVNGQLLKPEIKVRVEPGSSIAFGRIIFVFTSPADLYQGLKARS